MSKKGTKNRPIEDIIAGEDFEKLPPAEKIDILKKRAEVLQISKPFWQNLAFYTGFFSFIATIISAYLLFYGDYHERQIHVFEFEKNQLLVKVDSLEYKDSVLNSKSAYLHNLKRQPFKSN